MKNTRFFCVLAFIIFFTVSAFGNNGNLRITIDGSSFQEEVEAYMEYFGNYYSSTASNIDIILYSGNIEIYFELFVPNGNNRLVSGTYNLSSSLNDDHGPFTFSFGEIYFDDDDYYEVTGGTLTVSSTGQGANTVYTVVFDLDVEDDYGFSCTASGSYRGSFEWDDYSRD